MLAILSSVQNNVLFILAQQHRLEKMTLSAVLWINLLLLWLCDDGAIKGQFHSLCSSNFLMMVSR